MLLIIFRDDGLLTLLAVVNNFCLRKLKGWEKLCNDRDEDHRLNRFISRGPEWAILCLHLLISIPGTNFV